LFATPSFRRIKETYPDCKLVVNTSRPGLLKGNPYIDEVGDKPEGVLLMYTAPDSGKLPTEHHIIEDWRIICTHYDLHTEPPMLRPELYLTGLPPKRDVIGVQTLHRRNYHSKRVWPHFEELAKRPGFEAIPEITDGDVPVELVRKISEYKVVVCAEGGVSHIAAALNVPAVVVFGGFSDPAWTGYTGHKNIVSDTDYRHCYSNLPCQNDFKCWDAITLDRVEQIARTHK